MHILTTVEATGVFDPGNPGQTAEIRYAGWPGMYSSYYTNEVPTTATVNLGGLGAGIGSLSIPAQVGIVVALSALAYFGTKKLRTKGLLGGVYARRRRRRR